MGHETAPRQPGAVGAGAGAGGTAAKGPGQQEQAAPSVSVPEIPFPFQPYPAQRALMQQLYRTMEQGHVGLFESPTGTVRACVGLFIQWEQATRAPTRAVYRLMMMLTTPHHTTHQHPQGKSLSLICAGLCWLRDRQQKDDAGEADPAVQERERLDKAAAAASAAAAAQAEEGAGGARKAAGPGVGGGGPGKAMVKKTVIGAFLVAGVEWYVWQHVWHKPIHTHHPTHTTPHPTRQSRTGCGTMARRSSARRRRSGGGASRTGAWRCRRGCWRRGRRGTG